MNRAAENRGKSKRSANIHPNVVTNLSTVSRYTAHHQPDQRSVNHDNHEIVEKRNLRSNVFLVIKFAFVSGSSEAELNSVVHHCDFSRFVDLGVGSVLGAVLGAVVRGMEGGMDGHVEIRRKRCLRGRTEKWAV